MQSLGLTLVAKAAHGPSRAPLDLGQGIEVVGLDDENGFVALSRPVSQGDSFQLAVCIPLPLGCARF